MRVSTLFLQFIAMSFLTGTLYAVDLTEIELSIAKEPAYQSADPQYCLMVFGPEAKVRVWLVLDGDILYVDRNGNGDLTEPDERIKPFREFIDSPKRPDLHLMRDFFLNRQITDGHPVVEPILQCVPELTMFFLTHFIPAEGQDDARAKRLRRKPFDITVGSMYYGEDAALNFANSAEEAPILNFNGRRCLTLHPYSDHLRRGETVQMAVELVTPGLGASVRTHWAEGIEGVNPVAEFECPPRRPGDDPIRFRLELPGRG